MCTAAAAAGSSSERSAWASAGSAVVDLLDPRPRCCVDGGRNLEIRQRGAEIEAGAARDHRRPMRRRPDGRRRRARAPRTRRRTSSHRGSRIPTRCVGSAGLVGQDRQSAIDLERVGGDDLGAERIGDAPRDGRLARRRRAEDRDHFIRQFGHDLVGHPGPPPTASVTRKSIRVCHESCRECANRSGLRRPRATRRGHEASSTSRPRSGRRRARRVQPALRS